MKCRVKVNAAREDVKRNEPLMTAIKAEAEKECRKILTAGEENRIASDLWMLHFGFGWGVKRLKDFMQFKFDTFHRFKDDWC